MRLTKTAIDALTYRPERGLKDVHWDDELPGFGVRVRETGRKAFVLDYRIAGRRRLMTIGSYGVLTLVQARDMAKIALAEVLRGKDPMAERARLRQAITVAELCELYLERHSRKRKASARDDERMFDDHVRPRLGTLKIEAVTRRDVARLHQAIGDKTPTTANRILSLLSNVFNKAKLWGLLPDAAGNPAKGVERFPERKRERFVTRDEMPKLIAAIDGLDNVFVQVALWTYLLTGKRKSEVLRVRWEHFDPVAKTLLFEKTKGGKPQLLPLASFNAELLASLPRFRGNPHIFPGRRKGQPLTELRIYWDKVRKQSELHDIRLHDLRHTLASWLVSSGSSLELIGRILGHTQRQTTMRYAHFEHAPLTEALDSHAAALRSLPKPKAKESDVIEAHASPASDA